MKQWLRNWQWRLSPSFTQNIRFLLGDDQSDPFQNGEFLDDFTLNKMVIHVDFTSRKSHLFFLQKNEDLITNGGNMLDLTIIGI